MRGLILQQMCTFTLKVTALGQRTFLKVPGRIMHQMWTHFRVIL